MIFFEGWFREVFFCCYHMPGLGGYWEVLRIPVYIRKLMIEEFIVQKKKEHEAMEKAKKKT